LDKEKVINKFFRTSPASGPYPPKYYIEKRYRGSKQYLNYDGKYTNSYLQDAVTQKNIDDYIEQQKSKYKK
jgi:hypothetical protein